MIIFLRSTLFNLVFYGATAIACVLCLPFLLTSRETSIGLVRFYVGCIHRLEKYILGLDYEIRGAENLPQTGSYIIAAKHQSPYETLKLHILFDDPAVVLKKELLDIPLWGRFLARTHPIAIDRSQGKEAVAQVIDGASAIADQNRAIIIFPQGTRVYPHQTPEDKPYKQGVARMHESTGLPVIPLALNTGIFWPRKSWIKKPGTVVFEFLPPMADQDSPEAFLKALEDTLESATLKLQQEAGGQAQ